MRDLVKQKGLRKQRYSEFSATFTVATVLEETTDATGEASEHQAVRDLLHQPKLKAQRYSMFKATVSVGTVPDEGKETNDQASPVEADQG